MNIDKNKFLIFLMFILYVAWSFIFFESSTVYENIVTAYDEIRYLNATDLLLIDLKQYGFLYTLENYYNYSQSVHFLHYFVLAFIRYFFNDSMFFWMVYQLLIYCIGAFYFSRYMYLEYDFIKIEYVKYTALLILVYPVFLYLSFSLMRDISIFCLLSMALFFYKKNNFFRLFLILILLSFYRINMMLCILFYIFVDQIKIDGLSKLFIYFLISCVLLYGVDLVSFGFVSKSLGRVDDFNVLNVMTEALSFMFSPLPFTIDINLPEYLRLWFKISFIICLVLMIFNLILLIYKKFTIISPSLPIVMMSLLYIIIYSTEVGVGFRQASILLPFIYIPVLFFIIEILRKNHN
ncbi:hypothetical protein [Acinetobacter equi]|uniref:Wzy n=1 Tax=Acinetobacter equi TaxID=1324350 RepID=A0A0N7GXH3_9GAMM|nr:hypothetical protein [Acinetobacter equi]ALH94715.1 hypothetical protein AOY20_03735 [Acinetobacter equi]